jgi:hypothetical protein
MKLFIYCLFALLVLNCSAPAPVDNSAQEAFEKNSKTVLDNLTGWQNENLDYSMYADDFAMIETGFSTEKDSLSLSEMIENDKNLWATYDFKMLNEPVLLPGVNQVTKKPDGSVRHYSNWKITLAATDSTEAKSAEIRLYESFDFNSEGKIRYQQVYGDFTGIMMYLHGQE